MGFFATILFSVLLTASIEGKVSYSYYHAVCNITGDVNEEYRGKIHDFIAETFKVSAEIDNPHTILCSPYSIWMTMSAIAEGVDTQAQQQMFKVLRLPNDPCRRQRYYQLASRYIDRDDAQTLNRRKIFVDERLKINMDWRNYVSKHSLIDVVTAPIRSNPEAATKLITEAISAQLPQLNFSGNSVLLDSMDFNEDVKTSFSDAVVERAPFHDVKGQQIGTVDLMRMRRKVRMGYTKTLNAKVLELPFGTNSKYRLVILLVLNDTDMNFSENLSSGRVIEEAIDSLRESAIPLDVAIPQLNISRETDVRRMLEAMGLKHLWDDEEVTR